MKLFFAMTLILASAVTASADTLTLYTDRPTVRLTPIADAFTKTTGHVVNIVELPYKDLLAKLQAEGASSPADVILTKDLVFQGELAKLGFYQPMDSARVNGLVAATMRDPQGLWTAITYRVRSLVYDPTRTDVSQIENYEDLAQEQWAGKLCLRTSNNSYNEALVASFIQSMGYDQAKKILTGYVANLNSDVAKGDTALLEMIANGQCEVGLANHYYLAQLLAVKPNFPVKIKFLEQQGRGSHINGSGAGIAKTADNAAVAQNFIEHLLADEAQMALSEGHFEYPAAKHLAPNTLIKDWGVFKADPTNWSAIAEQIEAARKLVKEVDYK